MIEKMLYYYFLISLVTIVSSSETISLTDIPPNCKDSPVFAFVSDLGVAQTCNFLKVNQLRRDKYCNRIVFDETTISHFCQEACENCLTPPSAPSPAPNIVCEDNNKFLFVNLLGVTKNCKWLINNDARKNRYCDEITGSGDRIGFECKLSCDRCLLCEDDQKFLFKNNLGAEKGCSWLQNNEARKERYCNEKTEEGKDIGITCAVSCGRCSAFSSPGSPSTVSKGVKKTSSPASKGIKIGKGGKGKSKGTPDPTPNPSPNPTPNPSPNPTPNPSPNPTPNPSPNPTPNPSPNPTPNPSPNPTPDPSPNQTLNPTRNPTLIPTEIIIPNELPTPLPLTCQDDSGFLFETFAGLQKNCNWLSKNIIRQQRYCKKRNEDGRSIGFACAKSCNQCTTPTPSENPTANPSENPSSKPTPRPEECNDDKNFIFETLAGLHKNCFWLSKKTIRQDRYCDDTNAVGLSICNACAKTCKRCPSSFPSSSPSIIPTEVIANSLPTPGPGDGDCDCKDDNDFVFETFEGLYRNCNWLSKSAIRQQRYCTAITDDGVRIHEACVRSCNRCHSSTPAPSMSVTIVLPGGLPTPKGTFPPTPTPSQVPTSAPSSAPSPLPSEQPSPFPSQQPSPIPSSEPSPEPSHKPSANPSQFPSALPSQFPSPKPSQFPSVLPSQFPSALPSQFPSPKPSTSPSSRPSATPSSQPSATPTLPLCADDRFFHFTVDSGVSKRCIWLALNKIRRAKYCDRLVDGIEIGERCIASCKRDCFETLPPSESPSPFPTACGDDPTYHFKNGYGISKKCTWLSESKVRRQRYCYTYQNGVAIFQSCAASCKLCHGTDSPSVQPSPSPSACIDDPSYHFKNDLGISKKCGWLKDNPLRQSRYCDLLVDGEIVGTYCRESCDQCTGVDTPPPTFRPTRIIFAELPTPKPISPRPTRQPSNCDDDLKYRFEVNTGQFKGCIWLAANPARQTRYCNAFKDGIEVGSQCPNACGRCSSGCPKQPRPSKGKGNANPSKGSESSEGGPTGTSSPSSCVQGPSKGKANPSKGSPTRRRAF